MDKQTFSSIQATTNTSRYAAAVFRKGLICFCQPLFGVSVGLIVLLTLIKNTKVSHAQRAYISLLLTSHIFCAEDDQMCLHNWLSHMQT